MGMLTGRGKIRIRDPHVQMSRPYSPDEIRFETRRSSSVLLSVVRFVLQSERRFWKLHLFDLSFVKER